MIGQAALRITEGTKTDRYLKHKRTCSNKSLKTIARKWKNKDA